MIEPHRFGHGAQRPSVPGQLHDWVALSTGTSGRSNLSASHSLGHPGTGIVREVAEPVVTGEPQVGSTLSRAGLALPRPTFRGGTHLSRQLELQLTDRRALDHGTAAGGKTWRSETLRAICQLAFIQLAPAVNL